MITFVVLLGVFVWHVAAECVLVTRAGETWLDVLRAAGCGADPARLSGRWCAASQRRQIDCVLV